MSSTLTTRSLYRSRSGWIFGVCQGIAAFARIHVFWVRLLMLLAWIMTSFVPVLIIYIMAAIFMKPEPLRPTTNDGEWEFYNTYVSNRKAALSRLRSRFNDLERRTQRLESTVTDRAYHWDRRFRSQK